MDMMSDFENKDSFFGSEKVNLIERELANTIPLVVQSVTTTLRLFPSKEGFPNKRMKLETLIVKIPSLDKIDCLNPW